MMRKSLKLLTLAALFAVVFTACKEVPTAGFTYDPMDVTQYEEVTFTNTATGGTSYAWDFGDGTSSTDMDPTHRFTTAGTYTVTMVATNEDGDAEASQTIEVTAPVNTYMIDDTTYSVTTDMFWYQPAGMGGPAGDPYIRLITAVDGHDNPDLLKLYPNLGLNELPGTYTWDNEDNPVGTYDVGYTAGYAGMAWDWIAMGKTGSGDLVITELVEDIYKIEGTMVISIGNYNDDFIFVESGTSDLTVSYIGAITPLP